MIIFQTIWSFCLMLARNFSLQCWGNLGNVCLGNIIKKKTGPTKKSPKSHVVQLTIHWVFLYNVLWSLLGTKQGFDICNVVPRVLRQHWSGFFPEHCCLESQGEHYNGLLPVQCCRKSIKTKLNRIFSVQCWNFSVVWSLLDNTAQVFYLYHIVPIVSRQH